MSEVQLFLLPAFVQVALVFYILMRTGAGRIAALNARTIKLSEVDTNKAAYPEPVRNLANNYANQFELPVLYFAGLALVLQTGKIDWIMIALSWGFVGSRLAHSFVQTGTNDIRTRFKVFGLGMIFLALLWAWFGIRLFVIG
jgi:hypothetical protein